MSDVEVGSQLLDLERLNDYLAARVPGEGPIVAERHQAGHSNETFFLSRGDLQWVLRRPPLAVYLPTAHDVLREYRVLSALQQTDVRVPRVVLACEDEQIIGAPFYVMEKVQGHVLRDSVPEELDNQTAARDIGAELVTALAELHRVDHTKIGLDGFGKPSGYLERQLRRWTGQLELATSVTATSREVPVMFECRDRLAEQVPESPGAVVVQGDYKLDNVIYSPGQKAHLAAILDWEMSTIGDPLADVGWMISFWRQADDPPDPLHENLASITSRPGFMQRQELLETYSSLTGTSTEGIRWYVAFAVWKLACLLEGSYGRHLMGTTDDPFFARLETGVPELGSAALSILQGELSL